MAIYGVTIKGRNRRILVKAESAAKAVGLFCEAKALTAEQMQDALDEGESVWKPGQPLPDDGPAPDCEASASDGSDAAGDQSPPLASTEDPPAKGGDKSPKPEGKATD